MFICTSLGKFLLIRSIKVKFNVNIINKSLNLYKNKTNVLDTLKQDGVK